MKKKLLIGIIAIMAITFVGCTGKKDATSIQDNTAVEKNTEIEENKGVDRNDINGKGLKSDKSNPLKVGEVGQINYIDTVNMTTLEKGYAKTTLKLDKLVKGEEANKIVEEFNKKKGMQVPELTKGFEYVVLDFSVKVPKDATMKSDVRNISFELEVIGKDKIVIEHDGKIVKINPHQIGHATKLKREEIGKVQIVYQMLEGYEDYYLNVGFVEGQEDTTGVYFTP